MGLNLSAGTLKVKVFIFFIKRREKVWKQHPNGVSAFISKVYSTDFTWHKSNMDFTGLHTDLVSSCYHFKQSNPLKC